MNSQATYRIRLRVRIGKPLRSDDKKIIANVDGREITIEPSPSELSFTDAKWIVLTCGGFGSDDEARQFGEELRGKLDIAAMLAHIGVDSGTDMRSTWINNEYLKTVEGVPPESNFVGDVHGLMTYPDDGHTHIFSMSANMSVQADPDAFIAALTGFGDQRVSLPSREMASLRLYNLATINPEPSARILLAFASVEALGQSENWTNEQRQRLKEFSAELANGSDDDREIADALNRSIHRMGLRQGVLRVLRHLDLIDLKGEWDRLYSLRSGLVHGTKSFTDIEIGQLSSDAIRLCGRIIMRSISADGLILPEPAASRFLQ